MPTDIFVMIMGRKKGSQSDNHAMPREAGKVIHSGTGMRTKSCHRINYFVVFILSKKAWASETGTHKSEPLQYSSR